MIRSMGGIQRSFIFQNEDGGVAHHPYRRNAPLPSLPGLDLILVPANECSDWGVFTASLAGMGIQ